METAKDRAIRCLNEVYDNFRGRSGLLTGAEYDNEGAHIAAENIIMDLLYDLGYDDVVNKFEELNDMDNLDSDKLNELIKYYIYLYLITTIIKENYT